MAEQTDSTADLRRALDRLVQRQAELEHTAHLVRRNTDMEIALVKDRGQRALVDISRQLADLVNAAEALKTVLSQSGDGGVDMYVQTPDGGWNAVQVKSAREAPAVDRPPTSVRTAISRILASQPRPFETAEIVARVAEFGAEEVQAATTRSILAKMHRAGEVEQVKRGLYRAPRRLFVSSAASDRVAAVARSDILPALAGSAAGRVWVPTPDDGAVPPDEGAHAPIDSEAAQGRLDVQVDRQEISS